MVPRLSAPAITSARRTPGIGRSTTVVTAGWGILVATGSIGTIWPMFGIANQLLAVLALCLVYLTRQAPSAGGIFTFSSRFLHPVAGTILGWSYVIACVAVTPMTAIIGTQYLQALVPGVKGALAANVIGTVLIQIAIRKVVAYIAIL